jgi:SAM-dependent MidA family methyltransferase
LSIEDVIRERGPMTVAAFMELALYDSEFGYYARASQRSGRAGDFFTSVDVGPLFGDLLEVQIAECFGVIQRSNGTREASSLDLVEAGAGNGRLSADILRAARRNCRPWYERTRLHLVELSAAARAEQRVVLGDVADRLVSADATLPNSFHGVLIANELLDALPVHQVVMREDGLREVYVEARPEIATVEGPPSTPRLQHYLDRAGVLLEPGWVAEINLRAVDWVTEAARRLDRGFMILIDYGHEARDLYSVSHSAGTLTMFHRHRQAPAFGPRVDITSHVDFSSVRAAAEAAGLRTLGFLDQTYFLIGILNRTGWPADRSSGALKTLLMPGGLGSTHKVLLLGKGVGQPALVGCSFRQRVT